jgi:hypothetical protein
MTYLPLLRSWWSVFGKDICYIILNRTKAAAGWQ